MKNYSIRKIRKFHKKFSKLYWRKKKKLNEENKKNFEYYLGLLQKAIKEKNKEEANIIFQKLSNLSDTYMKQGRLERYIEIAGGLIFALVIAILIRQMWFEFYSIPSGSMRPTFKEKDYLVVSKTDFSLNVPLRNKHFYFNPDLLQRGNIVIFNGGNMDIPNVNTRYFFLFPGKKQYIKRLIGKPGDTLYFYGGKIYGIDKNKKPINEFNDNCCFNQLEYIPFIRFSGKVLAHNILPNGIFSPVFLYQMNQNVAKLDVSVFGQMNGEVTYSPSIEKYSDLWGMKNFAMARLINEQELTDYTPSKKAPLYLELKHHPKLNPLILARDEYQRIRPSLNYDYSVIPLDEKHLKQIFNHLTTARFVVKNKKAYRYGHRETPFSLDLEVPDGIYEFDDGILYKVYLDSLFIKLPESIKSILNILPIGGFLKKMPRNHPLYYFSIDRVKLLYNLGIEFDTRFSSHNKHFLLDPSRYAYFKNDDLYLLAHPILTKEDLQSYVSEEQSKQRISPSYSPFIDLGPPLIDGQLNIEMIEKYGLKVPEEGYLVLGDNHAMSSDSRDFGFVPQSNLKGGAKYIFWPISRIGKPSQPAYFFINTPKIIVWVIFISFSMCIYYYYRKRKKY